jgi:CBS domain-containing protein
MQVRDVMVESPAFCAPEASVVAAVEILRSRKCGFLPIVDERERVVGVVTDRDICMALCERNQIPSEIKVGEIATKQVFSCMADDDIRMALRTMGAAKVRRLPVVSMEGKLAGILSMDDIVQHAERFSPGRILELSCLDVVDTMKQVTPAKPPAEELEPANTFGKE